MLGFGHQTVFSLCMGLIVLKFLSFVLVALSFLERQYLGVLQQNFITLRHDNAILMSQVDA